MITQARPISLVITLHPCPTCDSSTLGMTYNPRARKLNAWCGKCRRAVQAELTAIHLLKDGPA